MWTGARGAIDSAPNDVAVISMHSRLDFDAQPLPLDVFLSLILSSRRAILAHTIQERDGQKSSREQGEVLDARVHRRSRCRKPSYQAAGPGNLRLRSADNYSMVL